MLTDHEIIKGLKWCGKMHTCKGCPYYNGTAGCINNIIRDSHDLINRQKTEIDILIRKKETLKDEIAELQHRNSELEIELKVMRGVANSYKAEVERLREVEKLCATLYAERRY